MWLDKYLKKPPFRTPFNSQHVKGPQTLVKSVWQHVYDNSSSGQVKFIWKMSLLVIGEILAAFVSTLLVDDKYPFWNFGNLLLPILMQLSKKRKPFCAFFVPFLESTSNFKHCEKRMVVITNVFPEFKTAKNVVRQNTHKAPFQNTLQQSTC